MVCDSSHLAKHPLTAAYAAWRWWQVMSGQFWQFRKEELHFLLNKLKDFFYWGRLRKKFKLPLFLNKIYYSLYKTLQLFENKRKQELIWIFEMLPKGWDQAKRLLQWVTHALTHSLYVWWVKRWCWLAMEQALDLLIIAAQLCPLAQSSIQEMSRWAELGGKAGVLFTPITWLQVVLNNGENGLGQAPNSFNLTS